MNHPKEHHEARLLAIDDSVLIHRLLKARLKSERLELHTATNGEEGLALAKALRPDVILLDVDMPGMTGFDVLTALKSDAEMHSIPVIFLSGSCDTDDKVRGFELGAVDFVTKPFDVAELRARVRSAVRLQRLVKMLAQRAQLDGLTGLWNRTYFDERLAQEVAEAERHDSPLSLVFCDIDHFKNLNDTYGHPFGDEVLEEFAHIFQRNRLSDIACRYGGEEFALIVPQSDSEHAARAAERIRAVLEARRWDGRKQLVVTASFGVTDLEILGERSPTALVASADRALYHAKATGRNRVVVDPPAKSVKLSA